MKKLVTIFIVLLFSATFLSVEAQTNNAIDEGVEINGVVWATRNVDSPGTFAENPENYGMYYQWNSNVGWSTNDPLTPSDGTSTWNSAWDGGYPVTGEGQWDKKNDPSPMGWRVLTQAEQQKLYESGWEMTTVNGVYGAKFGSGSNTIFLPAAGNRILTDGSIAYKEIDGFYWSSTIYNMNAYRLAFASYYMYQYIICHRSNAFSVRCVKDNNTNLLNNTSNEQIKVYVQNRTIIVENATQPVSIYNMFGHITAQGEETEFAIPQAGVYIVQAGNVTKRMIVN